MTSLLRAYHREYALLVENICGLVLQNTLGHLLLAKPLSERGFRAGDRPNWRRFSPTDRSRRRQAILAQAVQALVADGYDGDEELSWYLGEGLEDIAARAQTRSGQRSFGDGILLLGECARMVESSWAERSIMGIRRERGRWTSI